LSLERSDNSKNNERNNGSDSTVCPADSYHNSCCYKIPTEITDALILLFRDLSFERLSARTQRECVRNNKNERGKQKDDRLHLELGNLLSCRDTRKNHNPCDSEPLAFSTTSLGRILLLANEYGVLNQASLSVPTGGDAVADCAIVGTPAVSFFWACVKTSRSLWGLDVTMYDYSGDVRQQQQNHGARVPCSLSEALTGNSTLSNLTLRFRQ